MRLPSKRKPKDDAPAPTVEDGDVRKFRFILRTAPREAQEHLTQEALTSLDEPQRQAILAVLQQHAAVGDRVSPANLSALARAICSSELRDPGVLFAHAHPELMCRLARGALASPMSADLTVSYERWHGADPQAEPGVEWKDDAYGKKFEAAMRQRRKDALGHGGPGI